MKAVPVTPPAVAGLVMTGAGSAVATPVSAHVYVTAGCTATGRTGIEAEVMGPIVNVADSVGVGTARRYVTTT